MHYLRDSFARAAAGALVLSLALTSPGCKKKSEPSTPPVGEAVQQQVAQAWNGPLIDLIPANTEAWLYIDISALRDDARFRNIAQLLVDDAPDPLATALIAADELVVSWPDGDAASPLMILRSPAITPELRAAVYQGKVTSESELVTTTFGAHTLTHAPNSGAAMATPATNLLLTGPLEAVKTALTQIASAPPREDQNAAATFVFAIPGDETWGEMAEQAISEPKFAEQIRAITMVSGAIRLDGAMDLSARIALDASGNDELASELFGLAIAKIAPQLLVEFFSPEYALHLTNLIRITPKDGNVLVQMQVPETEITAWMNVISGLMRESQTETGCAPDAPQEACEAPRAPIELTP